MNELSGTFSVAQQVVKQSQVVDDGAPGKALQVNLDKLCLTSVNKQKMPYRFRVLLLVRGIIELGVGRLIVMLSIWFLVLFHLKFGVRRVSSIEH